MVDIETQAVEFISDVYRHIPQSEKERWGMKRYERFKTKCWRALETARDLRGFVNSIFEFYQVGINDLIEKLDVINSNELFLFIESNLTTTIGRMQFEMKKKKLEAIYD